MTRRRPRRWPRRLRWLVVVSAFVCVVLGVVAALAAPKFWSAYEDLEVARVELAAAVDAVLAGDEPQARSHLAAAARSFGRAEDASRHPAVSGLGFLPVVGEPSRAMRAVALSGLDVVDASERLVAATAELPGRGRVGLEGEDLGPIHDASLATAPVLRTVEAELRTAERRLTGAANGWIDPVAAPVREARTQITDVRVGVGRAAHALEVAAEFTGPEADARVLVLSQDSYELRPTGGFVGSYGILHFRAGTVRLGRYDDVGRLPPASPPIEAPPMLARALDQPFDLTNALWWPDFPTSARSAVRMWSAQGGEPVAGVLAFTDDTLAEIVDVVGPVDLPQYGPPVVKAGFAERVIDEVELNPLDRTQRKQFLIDLAEEVFRRLLHSDSHQLRAITDRVEVVSRTGGVQVWLADDAHQDAVAPTAWGGLLPAPDGGDTVRLVEANMTAGKANAGLNRHIEYAVAEGDDGLVADLRVRYRNDGTRSAINPYYNGYVRVYVPLGSELVDNDGGQRDEGRAPDGAYQVLSADVLVEPDGGEAEVRFRYRLPPDVTADGYRLRWFRQPGTLRDTFSATGPDERRVEAPARVPSVVLAGG